jgi:hypothetical protein
MRLGAPRTLNNLFDVEIKVKRKRIPVDRAHTIVMEVIAAEPCDSHGRYCIREVA